MTWQQFLTEKVLGEPKATSEYTVANNGDLVSVKTVIKDRTFSNRNDLMDLFERIWRLNKWTYFIDSAMRYWPVLKHKHNRDYFMAWLFCLDGEGHEERCKLVAEFYGWEGENAS